MLCPARGQWHVAGGTWDWSRGGDGEFRLEVRSMTKLVSQVGHGIGHEVGGECEYEDEGEVGA